MMASASASSSAAVAIGAGEYQYDFLCIGGGSGGLAAAKEAAGYGARAALLDYVKPSPHGTSWGLGGTCVNVGCIPKKLYHQAAVIRGLYLHSEAFGLRKPEEKEVEVDWERLREGIMDHIGSLNWGYKTQLRDNKVTYINALGSFKDAHTVVCTDRKGKTTEVTARYILVAVGGRPSKPDFPGGELCHSSDDIFSFSKAPGKTLVVGGSYVALECAGYLRGLGYDVSMMIRSIFLRGFDQQMAEMLGKCVEDEGVLMMMKTIPTRVEKLESGRLRVEYKQTAPSGDVKIGSDEFDTVLLAVGRRADTDGLNLGAVGVKADAPSGKIFVNDLEQSTVENIFAIGDCRHGGIELTPVAILAGRLLSRRLFGFSLQKMNYENVATTVYCPLEYGSVGLSEEAAIERFGKDDLEVYHTFFQPLEETVPHYPENRCYCKLICVRSKEEKVVGFHLLSPNAGEITQGFSLALQLGAKKGDFDRCVGIHPTIAEIFTTMNITKASGAEPKHSGC